ncbi:MAG: bifunctional (p)ppGpp synthetase/guanosine-3',5'-bis(diphosphate) 3'-pyrophosphohydrolase [Alloprevotella sp.]|nr:bifunctional (p)ppGpp synthetase/guanosine-3',5'-bis(diphosphate) 3'-pyrophosphohydrolase [Alloprevotella sp.]
MKPEDNAKNPDTKPEKPDELEAKKLRDAEDEKMINAAFKKLIDTYLASNHRRKVDIITRAFNMAKVAHQGVRRRSGEPYIMHPLAVAQIACEEIGLGSTSICAALLHDVEEDTDYTYQDISNLFGPRVANIVEGVTKISGGIFGDKASDQAETLKKLLLTMSDDVRVILIKISDRLHNMRTLSSMHPRKQYKIAGETTYIYAPLADRLGLNKIKSELEDLSFKYEHPEEYRKIEEMLDSSQAERESIFNNFVPPIREMLEAKGFKYHILQRVKTPFSIWQKMQNKKVEFDNIYDILALRIVYVPKERKDEIDECFSIYSALTQIYRPHPMRFRDWLSSPKANGYQALHNTFMSKQGKWIEVQIRSDRMDDIAEHGFAAHWKYKDTNYKYDDSELDKWVDSIKEILDDPQPDTLDLLDTIKLNLFSKEIIVFTPKGEMRTMPAGSTVLDFAFSIHSFLGSHCFGAKVNNKLVPLSYRLKSGDQIEIITSRTVQVEEAWKDYVTTAKARGKVLASLRHQRREKVKAGENIANDFLREHDFEPGATHIDKLRTLHGFASRDELCLALGEGRLKLSGDDADTLRGHRRSKGWRKYVPFIGSKKKEKDDRVTEGSFTDALNRKETLTLNEETLAKCEMAPCCHPIPGDDVLGYITADGRLEIHKRRCPKATKLKTSFGNNIIATRWDVHKMMDFAATIYIKGVDRRGTLHAIADLLEEGAELHHIALNANDGIFDGQLTFMVHDTDEVAEICKQLRTLENVQTAYRIEQQNE